MSPKGKWNLPEGREESQRGREGALIRQKATFYRSWRLRPETRKGGGRDPKRMTAHPQRGKVPLRDKGLRDGGSSREPRRSEKGFLSAESSHKKGFSPPQVGRGSQPRGAGVDKQGQILRKVEEFMKAVLPSEGQLPLQDRDPGLPFLGFSRGAPSER